MFEETATGTREAEAHSPVAGRVRALTEQVLDLSTGLDARECVELLEALERHKCAVAAVQARATAQLDTIRQAQAEARRLADPKARQVNPDAGLGLEIGLARHEAPATGRRRLDLARALVGDLPHTLAALEAGDLSEQRAGIIAAETSDLTREQRLLVDRTLAGQLVGLGDADVRQATRRLVLRLDEAGFLARRAKAHQGRRVTGRLLGDGMAQLTAILPAEAYSQVILTLDERAREAAARPGEERTRTQLMADLLAGKVTGSLHDTAPPVALKLVMSAESLLADDCDEPAWLQGCGHIPASVARSMVARGLRHLLSTVHRFFHHPGNGALVAMDSPGRAFRGLLADFLEVRDRGCRTPYCGAGIRHRDHIVPVEHGGQTSEHNGQGACEGCNYAKQAPGFRHRTASGPCEPHEVEITTPTGHVHHSRAPDPPIPPDHETSHEVAIRSPAELDVLTRLRALRAS